MKVSLRTSRPSLRTTKPLSAIHASGSRPFGPFESLTATAIGLLAS